MYIPKQKVERRRLYPKLFLRFPFEGCLDCFPQVNVTANTGIPLRWLNILIRTSFLEKQISPAIENMDVNHTMQQFRISVTF